MSSLYAKLIDVIERQITPLAGAIGQQKYVTSIRDGFITALPFMIVGSFLLVFIFPPSHPTPPGIRPRLAAIFARSSRCADAAVPLQHGGDDPVYRRRDRRQPRQTPSSGLADRRDAVADVVSAGSRAAERWPDLYCLLLRSGSLPPFWWPSIPPSCTPSSNGITSPFACRRKCLPGWRARLKS